MVASKIYLPAKETEVEMKTMTKDGNAIKQVWLDAVSGKEVSRGDTVRYAEKNGKKVIISKEDTDSLKVQAHAKMIDLKDFIPVGTISPSNVCRNYVAIPATGVEHDFSVLHAALRKKGVIGLGRWIYGGRELLAAVSAGENGTLNIQHLFYPSESRDISFELLESVSKDDFDDALTFIDENSVYESFSNAIKSSRKKMYRDEYTERLLNLIKERAESEQGESEVVEVENETSGYSAEVVRIA